MLFIPGINARAIAYYQRKFEMHPSQPDSNSEFEKPGIARQVLPKARMISYSRGVSAMLQGPGVEDPTVT